MNAPTRRLLAINFGGLGDEVLFLPTLQSIKSAGYSSHITLLTEPRGSGIAAVSDLIDANLIFDIKKRPLKAADYFQLVSLLRSGGYDTVLSSGGSPQVAALLFLSGINRRVGYGTNALARLLLTDPVPLQRDQNAARMYHDLVTGLNIQLPCPRPAIQVDAASRQRMAVLLDGTAGGAGSERAADSYVHRSRRVLIHPGTSKLALQKGVNKTWDPRRWAELIERLLAITVERGGPHLHAVSVVLAGGPDDAETIDQIMGALPDAARQSSRFLLAYGKTANLKDLVALIDLSDLVVCVDSAPMHLAVARDKPLVALFGPTDPNKLLWPDRKFIALRDEQAAQRFAGVDPFTQRRKHSPTLPPEPYVEIPLDTVFQTAMDQLNSIAGQGSSPESPG